MSVLPLRILEQQFGLDPALNGCLGCAFVVQVGLDDKGSCLCCRFDGYRHLVGHQCHDYRQAVITPEGNVA